VTSRRGSIKEIAMPTYDYQCNNCNYQFELFQGIKEPVKRKCPECGRMKLQRLIGPGAAIVFKGSGFYQTDYRSDSYKKAAEAEKKAGSEKSADKTKSKSESKDSAKSSSSQKQPAAQS
jgi:putative FmdB family regulatory protein